MSRRTVRCLAAGAAVLAIVLAAPAAAQTVVATVGPSPGCDFDDLQEAVDFLSTRAAERRIARLQRGTFKSVVLEIDTDQLEIVGGFEVCGDARPGSGRSGLEGGLGQRVVSIGPGPAPRSSVRLVNLRITNGAALFGGGLQVLGGVDVVLENSLVIGNLATVGGGIHLAAGPPELGGVAAAAGSQTTSQPERRAAEALAPPPPAPPGTAGSDGPTLTLLAGSGVNGNRVIEGNPSRGGGIACQGRSRIVAEAGSGIVGNRTEAAGLGGGIHSDGCQVRLTGPVTVSNNRATLGGGIFAERARLLLRGTGEGAVRVINNTAATSSTVIGGGGGLALSGPGTRLTADNVRIDDNRVEPEQGFGLGGGLALLGSAVAHLDRTLGASCPDGAACSSLSGNRAGDAAAAFVGGGSRLEIRRTAVHGNVAVDSVLRADDAAADEENVILLEGSTLTANIGRFLLEVEDRSRLEVRFSSAAGNLGLESVVRGSVNIDGEPGEVVLATSILYDTAPGSEVFDLDPGVALDAFCLVVPESALAPDGPLVPSDTATTDDPQFTDLPQRDLHLLPTSPALDVCSGPAGVSTDYDLDLRGHDLPEVPDRFDRSHFDAGADELGPPGPTFADGFERGNLSKWTLVVGENL